MPARIVPSEIDAAGDIARLAKTPKPHEAYAGEPETAGTSLSLADETATPLDKIGVPLSIDYVYTFGRPRKLKPDEATLAQVRGLATIQATLKECASALGVTEPTFLKFKADFPQVAAILNQARDIGRVSLRRVQWAHAEKNPAMAIFLGKQYLGQSDKQEITGTLTLEHLVLQSLGEPAIEGAARVVEDDGGL